MFDDYPGEKKARFTCRDFVDGLWYSSHTSPAVDVFILCNPTGLYKILPHFVRPNKLLWHVLFWYGDGATHRTEYGILARLPNKVKFDLPKKIYWRTPNNTSRLRIRMLCETFRCTVKKSADEIIILLIANFHPFVFNKGKMSLLIFCSPTKMYKIKGHSIVKFQKLPTIYENRKVKKVTFKLVTHNL